MRLVWNGEEFVSPATLKPDLSKRSHLPAPAISIDVMEGLRHPATGLFTDSKSTFRKMTKASGCTEVGDQAPVTTKAIPKLSKQGRVDAVKSALREQGQDVL